MKAKWIALCMTVCLLLVSGCAAAVPAPAAAPPAETAAEAEEASEEAAVEAAEPAEASEETAVGEAAETAEASEETAVGEEAEGFTIIDMTGREISFEKPAERIVALSAADCEVLYAVGAGDRLVGRGEYCDYPAEVLEIPSVQSGYETNIEQIIALEPEVLIMSTMAQTEEQIRALEDAGVKVVVSDAADIEGVYQSISTIGALTGHEADAAEVIESMKTDFEAVSERAEAARKAESADEGESDEAAAPKTVYFEVSPLEWGLWTAGSGTFMNEIAEMLGLENAFADVDGWGEISEEQVIERNPDYIVTITMYYGEGPTPVEEILSRPGWEDVTAVKSGAVLNLQNDELSRPAPRLAEGARMLCSFVYGEE